MEAFAEGVSLSKQIRASYDAYLDKIPYLLGEHNILAHKFDADGEKWIRVEFQGCSIESPKLLEADGSSKPLDIRMCRMRNLTYNLPIYTTVHIHRSNGNSTAYPNVYIGRIPLMVGSRRCTASIPEHDTGGYFLCSGSEKTIVKQKAHVHNQMMTLHRMAGSTEQWAICCKSEDGHRGVMRCTIRYVPDGPPMVLFSKLSQEISVWTLLQRLPAPVLVTLDAEEETFFHMDPEDPGDTGGMEDLPLVNTFCLGGSNRQAEALRMLLPHTKLKADYLLLMLRKLRQDIQHKRWADKDSLVYQRIETCEDLLSSLTHHLLAKMTHEIQMRLHRKMASEVRDSTIIGLVSNNTSLMDGIQYALATGNWRTNSFDGRTRVGVAQLLQRATIYTALSQLRRVSSSIKPEQKLSKPRYIHGTHRGRLCFMETPEGASCGLESQLSVGAYISSGSPTEYILELLQVHLGTDSGEPSGEGSIVFVNGDPCGYAPSTVCDLLRTARRSGQIAKDVSIALTPRGIFIRTNSGRICRPLLLESETSGMTFQELLDQGRLEYVDVYEEDTLHIGTTHFELAETLMMGLCGATIVYAQHNPAPRNTYQCAMMKQAQAVPTLDFRDRWDTTTNVMHYGQKPLVTTAVERAYNYNLPMGQNCIVAIMPAEYNQEDSTIWNQASIDRGIGRTTTLKTNKDTLGTDESYGKPVPKRRCKYQVDESGLPAVGQDVEVGDCLIGKIRTTLPHGETETNSTDVSVFSNFSGKVDGVLSYLERDGTPGVKVKVRKERIPSVGDKFASRSAQKGTIGLIVPQEDLPFTLDGIVPDIMLNPHALPSRMTMAQMLETVKSKYGCHAGLQDGSPFNGDTAESLAEMLHGVGFSGSGTQIMFDGRTGKRFKVPIFIGPTFYQRLKHNASDKKHARARGRRDLVTRQPNEGRASGGGLRVGEMEKDSFVSHSCPFVLTERLLHASDPHEIDICTCGLTHSIKNKVCSTCGGSTTKKIIPYGFYLLIQELQSMCVDVKLK